MANWQITKWLSIENHHAGVCISALDIIFFHIFISVLEVDKITTDDISIQYNKRCLANYWGEQYSQKKKLKLLRKLAHAKMFLMPSTQLEYFWKFSCLSFSVSLVPLHLLFGYSPWHRAVQLLEVLGVFCVHKYTSLLHTRLLGYICTKTLATLSFWGQLSRSGHFRTVTFSFLSHQDGLI